MSVFNFRRGGKAGCDMPKARMRGGRLRKILRNFFLCAGAASAAFSLPLAGCKDRAAKPQPVHEQKLSPEKYQEFRARAISRTIRVCKDDPEQSLRDLGDLLSQRHFAPDMIKTIRLYLDKSAKSHSKGSKASCHGIRAMKMLVEAKNFDGQAMGFARYVIERLEQPADSIEKLALLYNGKNFDPAIPRLIRLSLENSEPINIPKVLHNLAGLKTRGNYLEKINEIEIAITSAGEAAYGALWAFNKILALHSSRRSEFDLQFAKRLGEFYRSAYRMADKRYRRNFLSVLSSYFLSERFEPSMLGPHLIENAYAYSRFLFDNNGKYSLFAEEALASSSFRPNLLTPALAKSIMEFSSEVSKGQNSPPDMAWLTMNAIKGLALKPESFTKERARILRECAGLFYRSAGKRSEFMTLYAALASNPNYAEKVFERRFAKDLARTLSPISRLPKKERKRVISQIFLVFRNFRFSSSSMDMVRLIVRRRKSPSTLMLGLRLLMESPKCSDRLLDCAARLTKKSGPDDYIHLFILFQLVESPNFRPVHLDLIENIGSRRVDYSLILSESLYLNKGVSEELLDAKTLSAIDRMTSIALRNRRNAAGTIEAIGDLIKTSDLRANSLDSFGKILKESGRYQHEVFSVISMLWNNPAFDNSFFSAEYGQRIIRLVRQTKRNNTFWRIENILSSRNFRPSMLAILEKLVESSKKRHLFGSLELFENLISNGNFAPKNLAGREDGIIRAITLLATQNSKHADLVNSLLKNPGFDPFMIGDEKFMSRLERSGERLYKEHDYIACAILQEAVQNPNFRPQDIFERTIPSVVRALDELKRKRKDISEYLPLFVSEVVRNRNFRPSMLNGTFLARMVDICDYPDGIGSDMYSLLENEMFDPKDLNIPLVAEVQGLRKKMLEGLSGSDLEHAQMKLTNLFRHNRQLPKMVRSLTQNFSRGQALAKELKADSSDPQVSLSFAYALQTIGRQKAVALYDKAGIEYFVRYSPETLLAVYNNITSPKNEHKPPLLVLFAKNDHNGAFIREGVMLEKLSRYYRLIINEIESRDEFHLSIRQASRKFGTPAAYVIGGHGSPSGIRLGRRRVSGYTLDTQDVGLIRRLKDSVGRDPIVILVSCSTGQGSSSIGNLISSAWVARLFAPIFPSTKTSYVLDGQGKIIRVEYDVAASEFKKGR